MSVTIITRNSDSEGIAPQSLVEGELAVDVTPGNGKIYYGDSSDRVSVVAQQPYISNSTVPPVAGYPKRGAVWWQPDTKSLLFTADGVIFEPTAVSTLGGTFEGHVDINFGGLNYFKTSEDVVGDASGVKGIAMGGKLLVDGDIKSGGDLYIDGGGLISKDLQVNEKSLLVGDVSYSGSLHKSGRGVVLHYGDAGFTGGKVTVSTGGPPSSGMTAGDIHYTVEP